MAQYSQVYEDWLDPDGLELITSWARDGYTFSEIAAKIGITTESLQKWRGKHQEIARALKKGRELIDYQVENALLKSALGYRTKEISIRTTLRHGKIIEQVSTSTDKEFTPNVKAIEVWLYNRKPETWKKDRQNVLDMVDGDRGLQVIIKRAKRPDDEDDINERVEIELGQGGQVEDDEDGWGEA